MLQIGVQTVNTYIRRIYEKLHVRSRARPSPNMRTCHGRDALKRRRAHPIRGCHQNSLRRFASKISATTAT